MYLVSIYEEAPVEPESPTDFRTLKEARAYVSQQCDGDRPTADRTLAGERYDDGEIHVEAYYFNQHQSSGLWVTRQPREGERK